MVAFLKMPLTRSLALLVILNFESKALRSNQRLIAAYLPNCHNLCIRLSSVMWQASMVKSWMVIGGVTLLVALGSNLIKPRDVKWFRHLRRPKWLTFEAAIPVIWTVAFVCGAWSAYIIWENEPGSFKTWLLMGFYLLVELVTVAFTPVLLRLRSLKIGAIIGGTGAVLGILLALTVWTVSGWAALLLLPYVIWSPIGTFTTWQMMKLNPEAV